MPTRRTMWNAEDFRRTAESVLRQHSPLGYHVETGRAHLSHILERSYEICVCRKPKTTVLGILRKIWSGWPVERLVIAKLDEAYRKPYFRLDVYGREHLVWMSRAAESIEYITGFKVFAALVEEQEQYESWLLGVLY